MFGLRDLIAFVLILLCQDFCYLVVGWLTLITSLYFDGCTLSADLLVGCCLSVVIYLLILGWALVVVQSVEIWVIAVCITCVFAVCVAICLIILFVGVVYCLVFACFDFR